MKIKFIRPERLIRTENCFFYHKNLLYDKKQIIKSPEDYENKNQHSGLLLVYEKEDLKILDFDKYYNLYYPCDDIKIMKYKESNGEIFKINLDNGKNLSFRAIKNRLYYELYDNDLVLFD